MAFLLYLDAADLANDPCGAAEICADDVPLLLTSCRAGRYDHGWFGHYGCASQDKIRGQGTGTIRDVSVLRAPTPQGPDQQPETVEGDDELAAQ